MDIVALEIAIAIEEFSMNINEFERNLSLGKELYKKAALLTTKKTEQPGIQ
ncbi:MAG: hypothetical protein ACRC1T_11790 [Clostridium chrysemydis]|uniref:hypothetical protein n=1 Tax=Clostridium TaxID=1485 RepID=UPI003F2A641F